MWLEKVRKECGQKVRLMMFGNKVDLVENRPERRRVKEQEAREFAK